MSTSCVTEGGCCRLPLLPLPFTLLNLVSPLLISPLASRGWTVCCAEDNHCRSLLMPPEKDPHNHAHQPWGLSRRDSLVSVPLSCLSIFGLQKSLVCCCWQVCVSVCFFLVWHLTPGFHNAVPLLLPMLRPLLNPSQSSSQSLTHRKRICLIGLKVLNTNGSQSHFNGIVGLRK